MIAPGANARVYLACGVTDMRKGIDGLTALVQSSLRQQLASGSVFAFRGRRGDQALVLGRTGLLSPRLGGITKQGDAYLRHLLVIGARNIVRYPKARAKVGGAWVDALLQRRRPMIVAVVVANKFARIIWAMMKSGEMFREAEARTA